MSGEESAMELYFLRHGKAEELGPGERDSRRKLNAEGEADVQRLAKYLHGIAFDPALIVSSTLTRAFQTAQIVAEELNLSERHSEDERLAHGCGFGELRQIVQEHGSPNRIMIVGHQPDMGHFVVRLCRECNIAVPPGTLIRIDADAVEAGAGILKWLLPPSAT